MHLDIAGCWFVGVPNVVRDIHTSEPIIVSQPPAQFDNSPSSIANKLAYPKPRMPYRLGTPILVMNGGWANPQHCALLHTLRLGSGDGRDRLG